MNSNEFIREMAYKMRHFSILKKILNPPFKFYKKRCSEEMLKNFKKHGFEALIQFNNCLNKHNIKYTFAFGTLLGAVREHDFIPHDDDLDFTMWIDDYTPEMLSYLEEYGFKHKFSFSVEDDKYAKEDTFEYKGVLLDIFYVYKGKKEEMPYCCYFNIQPGCATRSSSVKKYGGLSTRKIFLPLSKDVEIIDFKGLKVSIPTNYDEVLRTVFGDNYLTPIPGWTHDDLSKEMPEWLCKFKEY